MLNELRHKVHFTELTPAAPGEEPDSEWNTYCREVGRLLAEGHEGRFVLIKGEEILGLWETEEEAMNKGYRHFLLQGFLVQQVRTWEPVYVQRIGYN